MALHLKLKNYRIDKQRKNIFDRDILAKLAVFGQKSHEPGLSQLRDSI